MFVYVCLGTELGLVTKPNNGGLEPKWTSELNIARFSWFSFDIVPIRFAGLNPVILFIKFSLKTLSNLDEHLEQRIFVRSEKVIWWKNFYFWPFFYLDVLLAQRKS